MTDELQIKLDKHIAKWNKIGFSTKPGNFNRAKLGLSKLCSDCGINQLSQYVWCESPLTMCLLMAAFANKSSVCSWEVFNPLSDSQTWERIRMVLNNTKDSPEIFTSCAEQLAEIRRIVPTGHAVRDKAYKFPFDRLRCQCNDAVWEKIPVTSIVHSRTALLDARSSLPWTTMRPVMLQLSGILDKMTDLWEAIESVPALIDWVGFYDFYHRTLGLSQAVKPIQSLRLLCRSLGAFCIYDNIAFLSDRPSNIRINSQRQLHCDGDVAVEYRDGSGFYFLNGVSVPEWLVMTRDTELDPAKIQEIQNAEVRREFVRKVGIDRIVYKLGGKVLDAKYGYELLSLQFATGEDAHVWTYLKMENPSLPGVWHVEGVAPGCTTVDEALLYRNGMSERQIDDVGGSDWYQQGDVLLFPEHATTFKRHPAVLT